MGSWQFSVWANGAGAAAGLPDRKLRKNIRLLAEQQGASPEAFAPKSEKEKKSHLTTPEFTATPLQRKQQ